MSLHYNNVRWESYNLGLFKFPDEQPHTYQAFLFPELYYILDTKLQLTLASWFLSAKDGFPRTVQYKKYSIKK